MRPDAEFFACFTDFGPAGSPEWSFASDLGPFDDAVDRFSECGDMDQEVCVFAVNLATGRSRDVTADAVDVLLRRYRSRGYDFPSWLLTMKDDLDRRAA